MSIKRAAACMLSLFLCLQTPLTAVALQGSVAEGRIRNYNRAEETASPSDADADDGGQDEGEENNVLNGGIQNQDEEETENRGAVHVEIRSVLQMEKYGDFTVRLHRSDEEEQELYNEYEAVSLESPEDSEGEPVVQTVVFSDLESGRYQLSVSGSGYETYEDEIRVEDNISKIVLMNDYLPGYTFKKGEAHPGILKLGDVNGDEKLDEDDLEELLEAIREEEMGVGPGGSSQYDLNGDGNVDLIDLQYFTIFYNNSLDGKASVARYAIIKPGDFMLATASNADKESVESIFDGREDTWASLAPDKDEEVSEDNPIVLSLELNKPVKAEGITIAQPAGTENKIEAGFVELRGEKGENLGTIPIVSEEEQPVRYYMRSARTAATAFREADGTIVLNLNGQTAVKKITITVTKTSGTNLADISKVEFVNDMKDRIPAPVMNIPKGLEAEPDNKKFTLTWKREANVIGYEVSIGLDGKTDKITTKDNQLEVKSFQGNKLKNGTTYTVKVQSVNGDWKSGYCKAIFVTPVTDQKPDPPESVVVTGGYKSLKLSWKDMEDTDFYTVFYRIYGSGEEFQQVSDIKGNSTVLMNLGDKTAYEVYLTGTNQIGESGPSKTYRGETASYDPPVTPDYKLMNVSQGEGEPTYNIESVEYLQAAAEPFVMVDQNYATAWVLGDWDAGVAYPGNGRGKAPIITFEEPFEMDTLVLIPDGEQPYRYIEASVYYWEEDQTKAVKVSGTFARKTSSNKQIYYEFQCSEPISPKRIQVNVRTLNERRISIAELKFYYYDSLESEIYGLYEDDMHMSLKEGTTQKVINGLKERLNTPDEVSGELNPKYDILTRELENAEKLLNDQAAKGIIKVHNDITKAADGSITFGGGLNAWQPLGVTAMAGESLVVYVGSPGKKTGDSTNLSLIATQCHGESSAWSTTVLKGLKVGANEITIPSITSLDVEQGGQLYVEYTGAKGKENYSVRVSGGSSIPMLDITTASSSDAKRELVSSYVQELEEYVPQIETLHEEQHRNQMDQAVPFERQNCILGATDIVMRNMMYSVSAEQILKGLSGSSEEKAEQLYRSLTAMENMTDLFYQHKGLSNLPGAGDVNRLPSSRLNIRYQRMFAGAFMYAGGAHIGIEWGSVPGLTTSSPVVSDENGLYESGRYFGWGIAHEIGHIINEKDYAVAEITNNYYSVLAQAKDTNDSVRFEYDDVYQKVTSGVKGSSSNVFTQLGMYWQLHLAYDRGGYNFKVYDTYEEQFNNLFFARMDSYARKPSAAPSPNGITLKSAKDKDNKLMRLACAAAEKDILDFFRRWGMTPDEETIQYASQFDKESRAIWFVNDEARRYAMEHGDGGSIADATTVQAEVSYANGTNQVYISLDNDAQTPEAMLGYEIYRVERHKDQIIKNPVGFATAGKDTFTDPITTVNNRVFTYEVIGYDKYLNPTPAAVTSPVKVSHNGNISKDQWSVTTNMVSDSDTQGDTDDYYDTGNTNPCEPVKNAVEQVIDQKTETVFTGHVDKSIKEDPYIIINLNKEEVVTGIVCTMEGAGTPVGAYDIFVGGDGVNWEKVKSGTFDWSSGPVQTIYFNHENDNWLYSYDASYVKLSAKNQKGTPVSIAELDILGQTGDNIELLEDSIGILKSDYAAGIGESGQPVIIPKGSIIFTGTYKGNPAYNTVLLFDENGTVAGGRDKDGNIVADQIILASVPDHGELGETSDGIWIYYIEPEYIDWEHMPKKVRAELYRTDNAQTNAGERLVSDTEFTDVSDNLPDITIEENAVETNGQ